MNERPTCKFSKTRSSRVSGDPSVDFWSVIGPNSKLKIPCNNSAPSLQDIECFMWFDMHLLMLQVGRHFSVCLVTIFLCSHSSVDFWIVIGPQNTYPYPWPKSRISYNNVAPSHQDIECIMRFDMHLLVMEVGRHFLYLFSYQFSFGLVINISTHFRFVHNSLHNFNTMLMLPMFEY